MKVLLKTFSYEYFSTKQIFCAILWVQNQILVDVVLCRRERLSIVRGEGCQRQHPVRRRYWPNDNLIVELQNN